MYEAKKLYFSLIEQQSAVKVTNKDRRMIMMTSFAADE